MAPKSSSPPGKPAPCLIIYFRVACVGIFGQFPWWPPPPLPAWPCGSEGCMPTLHTHLSSFRLPLAECGSQSPDAEIIRRLSQLESSSQTSFSFRHHCQIHSAKISLKKVISFFFFLIPDSLQDQIKTGAYNSWLFTVLPNLWAPLSFTTPFAQDICPTWTRLCSLTRGCLAPSCPEGHLLRRDHLPSLLPRNNPQHFRHCSSR